MVLLLSLQYTPEQSLALGEAQGAESGAPELLLSLQYTPEQSLALGEAQGAESGAPQLLISLQYTPEQSLALGKTQGAESGAPQLLLAHHLPPHVNHHWFFTLHKTKKSQGLLLQMTTSQIQLSLGPLSQIWKYRFCTGL